MFDETTKVGVVVLAVLGVLSGVRLLVDHFAGDSSFGKILGKVVDFLSANVSHK